MLTRLQVDGFKNLVDIDLRFGPFTCIAGANGVGKSNIFDALQFLSYLADRQIVEAVDLLRGTLGQPVNYNSITDIFRRSSGGAQDTIRLAAEMIIPSQGVDDLGQSASATSNFLRYELDLQLVGSADGRNEIKIRREALQYIRKQDAREYLLFPHDTSWVNATVYNNRRSGAFISTETQDGMVYVNLHQDGGSRGKPNPFPADSLPRTILSTVRYASEYPTALLARREMQRWKFLHLEPTALRQPNDLDRVRPNVSVASNGGNLPGTVNRLAVQAQRGQGSFGDPNALYATLANRLARLIPNVRQVRVDRDEKRRTLTLEIQDNDGGLFPARSLSDGTLRFLALTILQVDYEENSLICLEEPENGIHPERIPVMIELLEDMSFDPQLTAPEVPADWTDLSQVIINTHSPGVVAEVPLDSLVYVTTRQYRKNGEKFSAAGVRVLPDTWRSAVAGAQTITMGSLLAYLAPIRPDDSGKQSQRRKKVKDVSPGTLTLFTDTSSTHDA